jgi:hypothetical protein
MAISPSDLRRAGATEDEAAAVVAAISAMVMEDGASEDAARTVNRWALAGRLEAQGLPGGRRQPEGWRR